MPADSFTGLNCRQLYLDMSSNFMRDIHPDAFRGVEDKITFLQLENNLLTTVPQALTNLTNLILLDIHDNPIAAFDASVLSPLGNHLQMLHAGSSELKEWPQEFSFLESLQSLRLYHMSLQNLSSDAFKGFQDSLKILEINSTQLNGVPTAVCNLTKVNSLIFVNNSNIDPAYVLPDCPAPVSSMFSVKMDNNNLQSFPDLFTVFPNLIKVSVTFNSNITHIDELVPLNSKVSDLILNNNNLDSIPSAVHNCTNLKTLNLRGNNITALSEVDLEPLDKLLFLDVSHNPLTFLSETAFTNMSLLNHLTLDNTQLPNLPEAILYLDNIREVDYRNNNANCDCNELGWLQNMTNIDTVIIEGTCTETLPGESINTFINLKLPKC